MRAVDHAVGQIIYKLSAAEKQILNGNTLAETLYRPTIVPPLKHIAFAALADLFKYLPQSKADPQDIIARQKLQLASWMSLWPTRMGAAPTPLGLSHILGHKLGSSYSIPHGITSVCYTSNPLRIE